MVPLAADETPHLQRRLGLLPATALKISNMVVNVRLDSIFPEKHRHFHRHMFDDSLDLHNDLSLDPAFFEICQRLLRLIERKHLVNHRTDAPRFEKFADLCELAAI